MSKIIDLQRLATFKDKERAENIKFGAYTDNVLYADSFNIVEGEGTYVYKDIKIENISPSKNYYCLVKKVVGALSNQPLQIRMYDENDSLLDQITSTSNVFENIFISFTTVVNTSYVLIRLYASTSGPTSAQYLGLYFGEGTQYETILKEDFKNMFDQKFDKKYITAKGYNLVGSLNTKTGTGAYYKSGSSIIYRNDGSYGTDYTYFIFEVKKNTFYSFNNNIRWIIFVNENNVPISDTLNGKLINTGNATKIYATLNNVYISDFAFTEGFYANKISKDIPDIYLEDNNYFGNSMPIATMYFSIGITEKLYYNNMNAIELKNISIVTSSNSQDTHDEYGITITPVATFSNENNAVRIREFDNNMNEIYAPSYSGLVIKAMNLSNCSAIVIGDSTINAGKETQQMLDKFTEEGATLTLIGTRGSGLNKHEGRGGWTAERYCRNASYGDYTNPFYNNGVFDFSYYMQNNGFNTPDFVVIQLGINDAHTTFKEFDTKSVQALDYMNEIIESIHSYNSNIKIIVNPPTTPNSDVSKLSMYDETSTFRNQVIRYAMMLRRLCLKYNYVRVSNNNLILDTRTDIADNVHPTDAGYVKLGNEVVSQINCWQN